jgi:nucleoside-diphosphate-sugar epimerase
MRDLVAAVVKNPAFWQVVRSHPKLSRLKMLARNNSPRLSNKVKALRDAVDDDSSPNASVIVPAPWLAELYGPMVSQMSAAKARRVLGWEPRVDLSSGLALSRAWLDEVGLSRSDRMS